MGRSMVGHLMKQGHTLQVNDIRKANTQPLLDNGATFEASPIELAKKCDVLFMMLGYPKDVENMTLHPETGILKHMKPGSFLVDHTTSTPSLAERLDVECKAAGVFSVDAPVSGGDMGARNGKLVTMIGGAKDDVDACRPLLDCYSRECAHMGDAGAGQHTKAANQVMIATAMTGVCEALIYGHKAGLNLH